MVAAGNRLGMSRVRGGPDLAQVLAAAMGGSAPHDTQAPGLAQGPPGHAAGLPARGAEVRPEGAASPVGRRRGRGVNRHLDVADADTVTMTPESKWWVAHSHRARIASYVAQWAGSRTLHCLDLYGASGRVCRVWQAHGQTAANYDIKAGWTQHACSSV